MAVFIVVVTGRAGRKLSDDSTITLRTRGGRRKSGVSRADVMSHREEEVRGAVRRH